MDEEENARSRYARMKQKTAVFAQSIGGCTRLALKGGKMRAVFQEETKKAMIRSCPGDDDPKHSTT